MAVKKTKTLPIAQKVTEEVPVNKDSKELSKLVESLNKKFGTNAVSLGFPKTENGGMKIIERIPTGSFSLDIALGGGLPLGRFIEISGAFSSTKTTDG